MFDEQPDGDPHGECAAEIAQLNAEIGKLRFVMRHSFGYAPGDYTCRCHVCGNEFAGDKRAVMCIACADQRIDMKVGLLTPNVY